ncbi:MAG: cysteine--tRNA ligase [Candidatus Brennerbacteria bacterium]|nr:cysteine--tRNA ligase [Candidatus Brennerbacteria bacterium]
MLKLYNTLTRKKEIFRPLVKGKVGLYTCGPTVYHYAHIGNLRTYIFEDILERALTRNGYEVKRVMNVTDVGHLTSDADLGEDKLEKGAKREKKSPWDTAKFYTKAFLADLKKLNIKKPECVAPATKYVSEQIGLIERLFARGYAYETPQAVYFDISKFANYGKLSNTNYANRKARMNTSGRHGRAEVVEDPKKRHREDFALWFKRVERFKHHIMHWSSPWGLGFPGWHIECSAISSALLGQPFDIHTGGVDHIAVHHTNEIAQSEGAYGKPLARYWMHGEFLNMSGGKMAKSSGAFVTLADMEKKRFDPLAYRYFVLGAHYRTPLTFTWTALHGAANALEKLKRIVATLKATPQINANKKTRTSTDKIYRSYMKRFNEAIADDLNTPRALAALWSAANDAKLTSKEKLALLLSYDEVLGFGFKEVRKSAPVPPSILKLVEERELYRRNKQFDKADTLRARVDGLGYTIADAPSGPEVRKENSKS